MLGINKPKRIESNNKAYDDLSDEFNDFIVENKIFGLDLSEKSVNFIATFTSKLRDIASISAESGECIKPKKFKDEKEEKKILGSEFS